MTATRFGLACGAAALAAMLAALPAAAQDKPTQLGTFRSWTAWKGADNAGVTCYISAEPENWGPREISGAPVRRSAIHFLVINRMGLKTRNEVQTLVGYPFHPTGANVTATIDDAKTFPMVTEGEAAWLAVEQDEPAFVEALKAGSTLVVKGVSQKGNAMTDTYSLAGVTAAMTEIDKACT